MSGAYFAAFILVPCTRLLAQAQAPVPERGAHVRLTFPCEVAHQRATGADRTRCRLVGGLVRLGADTITIATAASTTSLSLSRLNGVEVSRVHGSRWLAGAGVGFLVGAGVTTVILNSGGSTSLCDRSANQDAISSGECLGLTALGGLAGAGLGALIGSRIRTERWQDIPVERLRVGLAPQSGGRFSLAIGVDF